MRVAAPRPGHRHARGGVHARPGHRPAGVPAVAERPAAGARGRAPDGHRRAPRRAAGRDGAAGSDDARRARRAHLRRRPHGARLAALPAAPARRGARPAGPGRECGAAGLVLPAPAVGARRRLGTDPPTTSCSPRPRPRRSPTSPCACACRPASPRSPRASRRPAGCGGPGPCATSRSPSGGSASRPSWRGRRGPCAWWSASRRASASRPARSPPRWRATSAARAPVRRLPVAGPARRRHAATRHGRHRVPDDDLPRHRARRGR